MSRDYDLENILDEFRPSPSGQAPGSGRVQRDPASVPVSRRPETSHNMASRRRTSSSAGAASIPRGSAASRRPDSTYGTNTSRRNRSGKKRIRLFPAILILLLVLIIALAASVKYGNFIFPGVSADSVSLGWKTQNAAAAALSASGWEEQFCQPLTVHTFCDISFTVDPVQAGIFPDAASAAETACSFGRSGNMFQCLGKFVRSFARQTDILSFSRVPDTSYLDGQISQCMEKVLSSFGDSLYRIDEDAGELVIIKGYGTILIDPDLLRREILSALEARQTELSFLPQYTDPVCPDMDAIHTLVCTDPFNAAYADDGSRTLIESKNGYEFDPSFAEALWTQAEFSSEVRIPLTVIEPEVTADRLEELLYHDLLGAVTTKYNNSNENRSSNVRLAASKINGTVLYPGEEFSFNDTVGVRTAEAGFLLAPAYAGYDDMRDEIGGGVCQVSTGIYAAALFSFLEITAHTCHVYPPNYIQLGTDTTVSIPEGGGRSIDFKFRNNKNSPIKIVAYCEEIADRGDGRPLKTVTVEIWGTLEPDDFMPVEFDNSYSNIYDYDRVIEPAYPDREGYKLKFTHEENEFEDDYGSGIRTLTHRKVIDMAGNVVQDRIINRTYSAGYALDTYYYKK